MSLLIKSREALMTSLAVFVLYLLPAISPAAERHEITVERAVQAIMRDGVTLRADIYRPVAQARNDVLVFTTPAFTEDLEVTGPVSLDLFASTSVVDTDFTAKLVDVWPDGFAQNLTEGIVRLRYRNSREKPELANPGEIYRFNAGLACEFQARPGSQNPVVLNTWARSEMDFISTGESGL